MRAVVFLLPCIAICFLGGRKTALRLVILAKNVVQLSLSSLCMHDAQAFTVILAPAGGTCANIISNVADCRQAAAIHGANFGSAQEWPEQSGVSLGCWTFTGSGNFDFNTAGSTNFNGGWNANLRPVCKVEAASLHACVHLPCLFFTPLLWCLRHELLPCELAGVVSMLAPCLFSTPLFRCLAA